MDIYQILSSKPNNPHYLKRYVKFISLHMNKSSTGEKHHICPKAVDMFPEYLSFSEHPWNLAVLTLREHYIAHWLLFKAFGRSQGKAFHLMCNRTNSRNSKSYEIARNYQINEFKLSNLERLKNGTHNFLTSNPGGANSRLGTHHTELTKNKIRNSLKGRVLPEHQKEKLRGVKRSPKTIEKMSKSKMKTIKIEELTFQSCTAAASHFQVSNTTITDWIRRGKASII